MSRALFFTSLLIISLSASAATNKNKTVGEILSKIATEYRQKNSSLNFKKSKSKIPSTRFNKPSSPPVSLSEVKPPQSREIFRNSSSDEAEIERITDQSIDQLYKIMRRSRTSPNRGEVWLRLAELYVEKSRLIEFRKRDEFDRKLELYQSKKIRTKPRLNLNLAKEYNRKAIQLYGWFIRDFPKDKRIDQALFFLGFNYFELGETKKGVRYYDKLVREHPRSAFVTESQFALGEYYFERNQWKNALKYYYQVADQRRSRLYTFALYKAAWCQYRLGKVQSAAKNLVQVIRTSRSGAPVEDETGRRSVNRIRLATEAAKDLLMFYAEYGDARKAISYFENLLGSKAIFNSMEKLAYRYSDLGKRESARYLFSYLLRQDPTSSKAFDYQYQIVTNYSVGGDQKVFREELFEWITNYGPNSRWARANSGDKALLEKAYEQRESTLRNHILHNHRSAQASRAAYSQKIANQGYELYIQSFPGSSHIIEMHFFYGELLYDMKRYKEASAQYRWVADNGRGSSHQEAAIINLLLSLERDLPSEEEITKRIGKSGNPVPFTESERQFEVAAQRYIEAFPRGEKASDVKFKLARLHYAFNHLDQAKSIFWEIVREHPKSQNALFSANLILDIDNLKKDYDGIAKDASALLQISELRNSSFGAEVRGIVDKAQFKKAQESEKGQSPQVIAKNYEDYARHNPTSDLALGALFNAGINYEKANEPVEAVRVYQAIVSSKVKDTEDFKERSLRLLGRLEEQLGLYAKAARSYQSFARENPKHAQSPELAYNAAIIQVGLRQYTSAGKNFAFYLENSKKKDKKEVYFLIAEINEKKRAYTLAIKNYENYIKYASSNYNKIIEAHYRIADLYRRRHKARDAEVWYKKTVAVQRKLSRKHRGAGGWFAAESELRLVLPLLGDFKSIRIPKNPAQQAGAVDRKLKFLNQLTSELAKVIKYDSGDQIVASLAILGDANEHMAYSVEHSPLPRGLSPQELQQYKEGLAKVSGPFKAKAIENYEAAINKGYQISAYNDYVLNSIQALAHLNPERQSELGEPLPFDPLIHTMGL